MDYLYQLQIIRENSPEIINAIFVIISEFVLYAGPAIPLVIYLCVDKKLASKMIFVFAISDCITNVVKITACVYRPWIRDSRLSVAGNMAKTATGYSFPSGHTSTATAIYGELALWRKATKWLVAVLIFLILLTGFARNYLGAHTLVDVITAMVISVMVIGLGEIVAKWVSRDNNYVIFAVIISVIIIICILYATLKNYPQDFDMNGNLLVDPFVARKDVYASLGLLSGWIVCWFMDIKVIHYRRPESRRTNICVGVIGVVIFAILYFAGGSVLGGLFTGAVLSFMKRFISIFGTLLVYPWVLMKLPINLKQE